MKILVVTSSFPRFEGDIAGNFVLEWADELEKLGHQLHILCWDDSSASAAPSARVTRVRYAPPGLDTLFYGAGTPENIRQNPARALLAAPAAAAMLAALARQIRRIRPDILVAHWLIPAGLLVRLAGRLTRTPNLIVGHSGGVHLLANLPRPISAPLAALLAAGPTTLPTPALVEKFNAQTPLHTRQSPKYREPGTLQMGVHGPDFGAPSGTKNRHDPPHDWLVMGRLVEIKRVELAIRAFIRADLPAHATLHIAGDGPLRPKLEQLASSLITPDTPKHVHFHGVVTGPAKTALFERCAFAIFASQTLPNGRHEGLPVSLLEAAAHGVIPICADIPSVDQYLPEPTLQRLPAHPHNAWHHVLARISALPDPALAALSTRQRALVAPLLWPQLIKKWHTLLTEIAHHQP